MKTVFRFSLFITCAGQLSAQSPQLVHFSSDFGPLLYPLFYMDDFHEFEKSFELHVPRHAPIRMNGNHHYIIFSMLSAA